MHAKKALRGVHVSALLTALFAASCALSGCATEGAPVFDSGSSEELQMAEQMSITHLANALQKPEAEVRRAHVVREVFVDDLAMAHSRVQQVVNDVPVFGGEAIVHMNTDGSLFAMTDTRVRGISKDFDTKPVLTAQKAMDKVLSDYSCSDCLTAPTRADLWVLSREEVKGGPRLVYRVQLFREDQSEHTEMPVVFIDAKTGEEVWRYNNLQTSSVTASGTSLYLGTVSITTSLVGSTYYLEDTVRKVGTFDSRNTTGSTYRFTDTDTTWNSSTQKAAVDAHYGAEKVYDYYKNVHGRTGIDGSGGPGYYAAADGGAGLISSKVHYSKNYNNAFWNGSYMTYGDGDGTTFSPLVTLDICGHEMTHGVTERTAGLVYSGESGALNESMSDVLGSMVERYVDGESANTWKIGEDAYTPGTSGDALRYLNEPSLAGDPDHYSERYTGTSDNGGVHTNSGIPNKAFYLVAKGGSHSNGGSMTGIGADKAAAIWYKALTTYMTSSTNFKGARTATLNAAAALYGSGGTEYNAVAQAWSLCGVN